MDIDTSVLLPALLGGLAIKGGKAFFNDKQADNYLNFQNQTLPQQYQLQAPQRNFLWGNPQMNQEGIDALVKARQQQWQVDEQNQLSGATVRNPDVAQKLFEGVYVPDQVGRNMQTRSQQQAVADLERQQILQQLLSRGQTQPPTQQAPQQPLNIPDPNRPQFFGSEQVPDGAEVRMTPQGEFGGWQGGQLQQPTQLQAGAAQQQFDIPDYSGLEGFSPEMLKQLTQQAYDAPKQEAEIARIVELTKLAEARKLTETQRRELIRLQQRYTQARTTGQNISNQYAPAKNKAQIASANRGNRPQPRQAPALQNQLGVLKQYLNTGQITPEQYDIGVQNALRLVAPASAGTDYGALLNGEGGGQAPARPTQRPAQSVTSFGQYQQSRQRR